MTIKKSIKIIMFLLIAVSIRAFGSVDSDSPIKSVTTITEVFGDGQKVIAVAVEYNQVIKNSGLSINNFEVDGRTITKVYSNTTAGKSAGGRNGRYVIIELSANDTNAAAFIAQGPRSIIKKINVTVKQTGTITTLQGIKYVPQAAITNDKQINLVVDDFKQLVYKDLQTGISLKYNLFKPKNYNPHKSYPLVLFIHDAGEVGTEAKATLVQGLGAVIWATPEEQAKHECFVLAPQFSKVIVNDNSEATPDLDAAVNLLNSVVGEYNIDKNRLYTTGQSMGCMSSIALNIKYPDLFAASLLVAGQWDPTKVAPLAKDNLWIIVSGGDTKAYPGMNAITATLEKEGAKVSRATWNGRSTPDEFEAEVKKMIAEGNKINYVVLKNGTVIPEGVQDNGGGNHRGTWRIAYTITGVRDWLFQQKKNK